MENIASQYADIYRTYADSLFAYGIGMGFPSNRCMDAIHDVFVRMIASGRDPAQIGNMRFYLLRSLKNRLIDMGRQDHEVSFSLAGENFHTDVSALDDMINNEQTGLLVSRVSQLLASLTPGQREAVYLRYMQDMEYDQIASLLGINADSARKLVSRAMEHMRRSGVGFLGLGLFMLMLAELR